MVCLCGCVNLKQMITVSLPNTETVRLFYCTKCRKSVFTSGYYKRESVVTVNNSNYYCIGGSDGIGTRFYLDTGSIALKRKENRISPEILRNIHWEEQDTGYVAEYCGIEFKYSKKNKILTFKLSGAIENIDIFERVHIGINDIVVKVTHKEMRLLDNPVEPIDGVIDIDGKQYNIRLYYLRDKNVYLAYSEDSSYNGIPRCMIRNGFD